MTVNAADTYSSNAELICAARDLGYLHYDWATLDPTYGLGTFWKLWQPLALVGTDLDPGKSPTGTSIDVTALPFGDQSFDAVVFDPPYKLSGTPALGEFDDRYGIHKAATKAERMGLIVDGAVECARVSRSMLLVKVQDQVVGGRRVWQSRIVADTVEGCGFRMVDQLLFLNRPRPQPPGRPQRTSLMNYSNLLIFRRGS